MLWWFLSWPNASSMYNVERKICSSSHQGVPLVNLFQVRRHQAIDHDREMYGLMCPCFPCIDLPAFFVHHSFEIKRGKCFLPYEACSPLYLLQHSVSHHQIMLAHAAHGLCHNLCMWYFLELLARLQELLSLEQLPLLLLHEMLEVSLLWLCYHLQPFLQWWKIPHHQ